MNTSDLSKHLLKSLTKRKDFSVLTTNLSWQLAFEADVFMVTTDLEIIEYELKISRGDFAKEIKKQNSFGSKFEFLLGVKNQHNWYQAKRPNKFFYVCPQGLISTKDVPKFAGLIWVLESGQVVTVKHAKKLHDEKTDSQMALSVARNFCLKQCSK